MSDEARSTVTTASCTVTGTVCQNVWLCVCHFGAMGEHGGAHTVGTCKLYTNRSSRTSYVQTSDLLAVRQECHPLIHYVAVTYLLVIFFQSFKFQQKSILFPYIYSYPLILYSKYTAALHIT